MSKFCASCGMELEDNAVFCGNCGARTDAGANVQNVQNASQNEQQTVNAQTAPAEAAGGIAGKANGFITKLKNKDKKALGIVAGVLVVVIALIVVAVIFSGGGPEDALEKYVDVVFNGDIDDLEDLAPKEYWDFQMESTDMSMSDFEEAYEAIFFTLKDRFEESYGDDVKVTVKVTDTEDVPSKTLKAMKDTLKENYDISKSSVKAAVRMDAELTIKGDDDKDTKDAKLYAVKIDGDWYICSSSGDLLDISSDLSYDVLD